ncbi:MAG: carbamoyltransferase C-terminal domain-containing protein [Methylocystis sp.]
MGNPLCLFQEIPDGSVIGLNYSGLHDSAVAIVSPTGELVSAVSLERLSRVKQDGRWPTELLKQIPWPKIRYVAVAGSERYSPPEDDRSRFLSREITHYLQFDRSHGDAFASRMASIGKEIIYVPHHLAHASSSFWASGYDNAICLVYDGGMTSEHWFGGVYSASRSAGLSVIDQFSAARYSNVALLYAAVTAILGFRPNKHEGKLTGLAARGAVNARVSAVLDTWLREPELTHHLTWWSDAYDLDRAPTLGVLQDERRRLRDELSFASPEDIAATLQYLTERHICDIIDRMLEEGIDIKNICLAGGLFSNVKVNQVISRYNIENLFVFPAMTDDGAAVGAAWQALFTREGIAGKSIEHVFVGPTILAAEGLLETRGVKYTRPRELETEVAKRLANGEIGAVARGAMEFGPRSLGDRSILASPRDEEITEKLNLKLSRSDFMPFAPVTREEDADRYFIIPGDVARAAQYMTVTVECAEKAKVECPAVVHVDNTARPQLVTKNSNPFLHRVLSELDRLGGEKVLINTSFNIHEEPIVASAEDALRGFFEAGLDFLVLGDCLVSRSENIPIELDYVRGKASGAERRARNAEFALESHLLDRRRLEMQLAMLRHEKEELGDWKSSILGIAFLALARLRRGGHSAT